MARPPGIELLDERGLICGFQLHPQGPATVLAWQTVVEMWPVSTAPLWLHFNLSDARARTWISTCDRLPPAARELFLAADPRIQLDRAGNGLIGVIGDFYHNFDTDPDGLGVLRLYIDSGCLITGRRRPLKTIDRLRQDVLDGIPVASPMQIVLHLLQRLTEMLSDVIQDRSDVVDDIEDLLLKDRFQEQRSELGRVRRLLVRLHRQARANRQAILQLKARFPSWCDEVEAVQLHSNLERLEAVSQDLELVQERSRLLQEEIAGRLDEAVNRNLYVLSIVTTVFLPITLITGIFGMNVGGLPWTEDAFGFTCVAFVMGMTFAVTVVLLQRQRFF
jgi:zinc transporter